MIPILVANIVGPTIDVSGRMITLAETPNVRTRLMTIYITLMFVGAGIGSWAGTAAYDWSGWNGAIGVAFLMGILSTALSAYSYFRHEQRKNSINQAEV